MAANLVLARRFVMDPAHAGPWYLHANQGTNNEPCKICTNPIGRTASFYRLMDSPDPQWIDAATHSKCLNVVRNRGADFLDLID